MTLLSIYLLLLTALPSQLTFAPLGGAGSPARILGLLAMGWWIYQRAQGAAHVPRQPVRTSFFVLLAAVLVSYVAASFRPLPSSESNTALLALVLIGSFGGSLLVACDGIPSLERLLVLQRRIVLAGAGMALLACVQFATGQALVDKIAIPGLSLNNPIYGVASRSGMNRPSATAIHPIELGMVLTMVLPLAFNLAFADRTRSSVRRYAPLLLILIGSVLCISRSAIIGIVVGLAVVVVRWPPPIRLVTVVTAPVFIVALSTVVPGLLGTIVSLFSGAGGDSSVQSRTGSYQIAGEFISHSPLIGRGFGTFLPQYRILDNQYLLLIIEIGFVGTACFLALIIAGLASARYARRRAQSYLHEQMAQGLLGSIAVGGVCLAFFDGLSFPIGSGLLFLLIGMAGAGYACTRAEREANETPTLRLLLSPLSLSIEALAGAVVRRWYVAVAGLALTAVCMFQVVNDPGMYWTQTETVLLAPKSTRFPNSFSGTSDGIIATAGLIAADVSHQVGGPATASAGVRLPDLGITQGESVRVPDTGGQWAHNFERPAVDVEVVGPDEAAVRRRANQLIDQVGEALAKRQRDDGTLKRDWITMTPAPDKVQIFHLSGQGKRGAAALLVLGTWLTLVAAAAADHLARGRSAISPTQQTRSRQNWEDPR